jgi:predicted O-methyltransferase YrrM
MSLRSFISTRRDTATNPVVLLLFRLLLVARTFEGARAKPRAALRYLARGREVTNLTYELANLDQILGVVASVLQVDAADLRRYARELSDDSALYDRLSRELRSRPNRAREPRYGKRHVTYSIVRAVKPGVIVETGTFDGLGTVVLLRALERNRAEGSPGRIHTIDINPAAGWLIPESADEVTRHIGSSEDVLSSILGDGVDFFIHDSVKVYELERYEFESALERATGPLVLYSDDVRATGALRDLSTERGLRFGSCREVPLSHFWPGNELGIAYAPAGSSSGSHEPAAAIPD